MGPNPLPVTMVGGTPAGPGSGPTLPLPTPTPTPNPTRQEEGWAKWAFDRVANLARPAAAAAEGVAANTVGPALKEGAAAAAAGLARLGPIGVTAAAGLKAVSEGFSAVQRTIDAFAERGHEISGYSGQISTAVAMQDVARTLADIREAQQLGGGYAKLIEAQTRFERTMSALIEPIKEWILEKLPPLMDRILEFCVNAIRHFGKGSETLTKLADDMEKVRKSFEAPVAGWLPLIDQWVHAARDMNLLRPDPGPAGVPDRGVRVLPILPNLP